MGSSLIRRSAAAAVLLLCGVSVVACDDEPDPAPDTESSSTPSSPSTSPVTTAPPHLTPVETVERWVAGHNTVVTGGPPSEVYAVSTADCSSCTELIEPIVRTYEDGGRFETDGWRMESARKDRHFDRNHVVVAGVTFLEGRTFHDATSPPVEYEDERHILRFLLRSTPDGWKVGGIEFLS